MSTKNYIFVDTIAILRSKGLNPFPKREGRPSGISNPFERKNTSSMSEKPQVSRQDSHISRLDSFNRDSVFERGSILNRDSFLQPLSEERRISRRDSRSQTEEPDYQDRRTTFNRSQTRMDTKSSVASSRPSHLSHLSKISIIGKFQSIVSSEAAQRHFMRGVSEDDIDERDEFGRRESGAVQKRRKTGSFFITERVETQDAPKNESGFNPAERSALEEKKIEEFSVASKAMHETFNKNFALLNKAIYRRESLQNKVRLNRNLYLDWDTRLRGIEKGDDNSPASTLRNRVPSSSRLQSLELTSGKSGPFQLRKCEFLYFSLPTLGILLTDSTTHKIKVMTSETNRFPNIFNYDKIAETKFFKHYAFEHKKLFEKEYLFFSIFAEESLRLHVQIEFENEFQAVARKRQGRPATDKESRSETDSELSLDSEDTSQYRDSWILDKPGLNKIELNKNTDEYKPGFLQTKRELRKFMRKQEMELRASVHDVKEVIKEKLAVLLKFKQIKASNQRLWLSSLILIELGRIIRFIIAQKKAEQNI